MNQADKYFDEKTKNEFLNLVQMLEQTMDFKRWGFQKIFLGISENFPPSVIYDSEWCRVRFNYFEPDPRDQYKKITSLYGRLHAPVNEIAILWNGEKCYCWHQLELALNFLDGLSPKDLTGKSETPKIMEKYYRPDIQSVLGLEHIAASDIQPAVTVRMCASIWDHYGQELFNLFDLRHPELWEQYRLFVKEYYKLNPRIIKVSPPLDSIC
jgi:hypothetical protein